MAHLKIVYKGPGSDHNHTKKQPQKKQSQKLQTTNIRPQTSAHITIAQTTDHNHTENNQTQPIQQSYPKRKISNQDSHRTRKIKSLLIYQRYKTITNRSSIKI